MAKLTEEQLAEQTKEVEKRKRLLKEEQLALVKVLDTLQPFTESSQYKIMKSVMEFFGIRVYND